MKIVECKIKFQPKSQMDNPTPLWLIWTKAPNFPRAQYGSFWCSVSERQTGLLGGGGGGGGGWGEVGGGEGGGQRIQTAAPKVEQTEV